MTRPPLVLLLVALGWAMFMCASAGVVFAHLTNALTVPAAWAANWRLAWVQILQTPAFCWTVTESLNKEDGDIFKKSLYKALPLLILSGVCLGLHFTAWVVSLQETSLTHSLLWVSMGPILLNATAWFLFIIGSSSLQPSPLETAGAVLGVFGSLVMLRDVGDSRGDVDANAIEPSWQGDMMALAGAAAVSLYLVIGRHLREWMPTWIYSFVVVGAAYLTTLILAVCQDPKFAGSWVLGFLHTPYVWYAIYLGLGPGLGGHTLVNGLLKYISPLLVSTAMLSEPILGSLLGYFLGFQETPGLWTWLGGALLMVGLVLVVVGSVSPQPAPVDEEVPLVASHNNGELSVDQ